VADAASIRESPRGLRTDAGLQRISPLQGFHGVICPPPRPPLRCDLGYRISPRWGFRLAHCEPVWRNKADGVQWMFSALFQQPRTGMRGRLSAGSQRRLELSGDSRRATKPHAHSGHFPAHCHQTRAGVRGRMSIDIRFQPNFKSVWRRSAHFAGWKCRSP
jgi:hypothetical protein